MKIGFFTDAYLPSGFGVATSIESFRKNLEKFDNTVYIFAPFFKNYKDNNPRVFRFKSLKVIKNPEVRLASPFFPFSYFEKTNKIGFDIIHAHTPFALGLFGKYIANKNKIPIVYTHHTQYPEYAKFYLKEGFISPYIAQIITVWFSNISDAVIAPSLKIKNILLENGVKKDIYILPTGINTKIFKKSEEDKIKIKKLLKIPKEKKILLFVGRIGKEKNIDFLIEVFKELLDVDKNIYLIIIGDGPYLEKLKETIQRLQLNYYVKLLGSIPYEKIPQYYQLGDIFVFSSITDTQGIVILEALASGLPVVALKDDAFRNIILDNENGFLIDYSNNIKAKNIFTKKILELFNNYFLYQKLCENAIKTAQQFSEEKQTKKLIKIYSNLIKIKKNQSF
jgi:1,2-diacylglycerol 3-alpha-glucosyltransferase